MIRLRPSDRKDLELRVPSHPSRSIWRSRGRMHDACEAASPRLPIFPVPASDVIPRRVGRPQQVVSATPRNVYDTLFAISVSQAEMAMQLSPVRFRIRSLLILVALVATTLWAVEARRRWSYCRWRAECHASEVLQIRENVRLTLALAERTPSCRWSMTHDAARRIPYVAWHAGQAARFRRAMWRPWNPLPVEHPEPELEDIPPEPPSWPPSP